MPPLPSKDDDNTHQLLLDSLDLALKPRPFRHPAWKPSQRRNKNIKQILSEAARKEASLSVLATQNNSGASTPLLPPSASTGAATPLLSAPSVGGAGAGAGAAAHLYPPSGVNIAQAAQSLSTLVLERNLQAARGGVGGMVGVGGGGMGATYTNIESAPSLHPAHQRPYCDITGLPAGYTDPKSRLRYFNREVFELVRGLPQGVAEKYLEARGAHVVLK